MRCIETDSLSEAESLMEEAMKLEPANPSNAMLFANLGQVQRRLGETQKAVDSYSYAVNMMPRNVSVLLDRAALYLELGKYTPALYDYNRVLDLEPDNEEALSLRAYTYMSKRELELARTDYNRLLTLKPNDYDTMLGLITLNQQEMKYRDALDMVNQMMVSHPDDALLLTVRADIERETKHEDLALIDLDRAIELNPQLTDAYLLRGDIYLLQNKRQLARADFEKAISLGVPQSQLHDRLMMVK
jgi:tetratricopeptide (TPR) repeat protein